MVPPRDAPPRRAILEDIGLLSESVTAMAQNWVRCAMAVTCFNCSKTISGDVLPVSQFCRKLTDAHWEQDALGTWWCGRCAPRMPAYVKPQQRVRDGDAVHTG